MGSLAVKSLPHFTVSSSHQSPVHSTTAKCKATTTIFLPSPFPYPPLLHASSLLHFRPASSSFLEGAPSTSEPFDDIFLPFLQSQQPEEEEQEREANQRAETTDAIHRFFKYRAATPDPLREGRIRLKKNRHLSWSFEDAGNEENDDANELLSAISPDKDPFELNIDHETIEDAQEEEEEEEEKEEEGEGNEGVAEEIVRIAKSMPPSAILSEFLSPYEGRVDGKGCVSVIRSLVEEGMIMPALYFFEWMQLQEEETELVTPRTYSLLFTVLGRAGMGDRILVLFGNMPKGGGRFRDLHLYNSIISALSCCRRDIIWSQELLCLVEASSRC